MATYDELLTAANDSSLGKKIAVACTVAAEKIRTEGAGVANHANRAKWAKAAFANPTAAANGIIWCVLAQNRALTLAQITSANDAAVQSAVDAAVDGVADGA